MSRSPGVDCIIREARPDHVRDIVRLIRDLAAYEKLSDQCDVDERRLAVHLFGRQAFVEALVADVGGRIVGFALFFHNYSTFRARPGIFVEDLFVEPEYRRRGIGTALLRQVMDLAAERDCGRVEWMVLDWNKPSMEFYRRAFGAESLPQWVLNRVSLGLGLERRHAEEAARNRAQSGAAGG